MIPAPWLPHLSRAIGNDSFHHLQRFLQTEEGLGRKVYPPASLIYRSLELVAPSEVRVVILGQDPYHGEGQAIGLSFGVPNGLKKKPPSLKNIFKELQSDLGILLDETKSDLTGWAKQGVLLLNTTLTVRAQEPLSHQNQGWEPFTDSILQSISENLNGIVFVLWGSHAQKKRILVDQGKHIILESAHPSPLSAYRGFFGSKIFSKINSSLTELGKEPIDWSKISSP